MKNLCAIILADDDREDGTQFGPSDGENGILSIKRIVETFRNAGICNIVIASILESKSVKSSLRNENLEFACGTYYIDGIDRIIHEFARVMIIPACYSVVGSSTVAALAAETARGIIAPSYKGETGFPLVMPSKFLSRVMKITIPGNLTDYLTMNEDRVTPVDVDDMGVVTQSQWCEVFPERFKMNSMAVLTKGNFCITQDMIQLLKLIDEEGSVKDACSRMGISYSYAWKRLRDAEQMLGFPLVWKRQGGSNGGGTELYTIAREFMDRYKQFVDMKDEYIQNLFCELFPELQPSTEYSIATVK